MLIFAIVAGTLAVTVWWLKVDVAFGPIGITSRDSITAPNLPPRG